MYDVLILVHALSSGECLYLHTAILGLPLLTIVFVVRECL